MMRQALVVTAALVAGTQAFFRMECQGRVGLARVDPLVDLGKPSGHVHNAHGSSGFSMTSTFDDLRGGSCTSCRVKDDLSAYWTPSLYFFDSAKQTYELVPQVGGMLSYYLFHGNNIKAFPPGFGMIAGTSSRRSFTVGDPNLDPEKSLWAALGQDQEEALRQRAVGFNCLNYDAVPEPTLMRHGLPDKAFMDRQCADGIRAELAFPSCWDGETLTTQNHKDHVRYSSLVIDGVCPPSHPVRLPTLLYETIWNTNAFKDRAGKFIFSNNDETGFGYHGDFMTGWDQDFLQSAIDTCGSESGRIEDCPVFSSRLQSEATVRQCAMEIPSILKSEDVLGPMAVLPGHGPATEPKPSPSPSSAPATPSPSGGVFMGDDVQEAGQPVESIVPQEPANAVQDEPETTSTPQPTPTSTTPPPPPPPPPATTAAPAEEEGKFFSTQWVTVGSVVSKILWEEEVVFVTEMEDLTTTVTVTATNVKKVKREEPTMVPRHLHMHRHGRRRF